ncbi:ATP-binding protein [Streptomyces sp. NPDC054838]
MEDVLLLVSEVVTNACLHAGGPRELVLRHSPEGLRVEVSDDSPEPPRRRPPGDRSRPGGHGLIVLERLATKWGAEPSGGAFPGKTVWLEVPPPALPRDPRPAPFPGPGRPPLTDGTPGPRDGSRDSSRDGSAPPPRP